MTQSIIEFNMANLNFGFNIHTFSFDSAGLQQASEVKNATNWPVVYLINNANVLYVGETTSFERRFSQHLQSKEKKNINSQRFHL